jgi:hypothetical protein
VALPTRDCAVPALPVDRGCAVEPVLDPDGAVRAGAEGAERLCAPPPDGAALAPDEPPEEPPEEPEEEDEPALPRATACPSANAGVARPIATAAVKMMRMDLVMTPPQEGASEAFPLPILQLYCQPAPA